MLVFTFQMKPSIPLTTIRRAGIAASAAAGRRHCYLRYRSVEQGQRLSGPPAPSPVAWRSLASAAASCRRLSRQHVHLISFRRPTCIIGPSATTSMVTSCRPLSTQRPGRLVINLSPVNFEGMVLRVIYCKDDYCVCILKRTGDGEEVKIVGNLRGKPAPAEGNCVQVWGQWGEHHIHGKQLNFHEMKMMTEIDNNDKSEATNDKSFGYDMKGVAVYIASTVPNINNVLSERIVETYGEHTMDIIRDDPERLAEIDGIGKDRIQSLKEAFVEEQEDSAKFQVVCFLTKFGVSWKMCRRISEELGPDAVQHIRLNPYCLVRIPGMSFRLADYVALKVGIARDDPIRVHACVNDALRTNARRTGNTALLDQDLFKELREKPYGFGEELRGAVASQVSAMASLNLIRRIEFKKSTYLQLSEHASSEEAVAVRLRQIQRTKRSSIPQKKALRALESIEKLDNNILEFDSQQKEAIKNALSNKVSVISGGPGTGKTSIVKALCEVATMVSAKIILAAPTGAAAQRLEQATGQCSQTIHRTLVWREGKFVHNEQNKLSADIVVIDEASMADTYIASCLLRAIPDNCHVVLVGDIDQLPSVGPGKVLKDIMSFGHFPVSRLEFNYRQAVVSSIVKYAHSANRGDSSLPLPRTIVDDLSENEQFQYYEVKNGPGAVASAVKDICDEFVRNKLGKDPVTEMQVLVPKHKGDAGRERINEVLQAVLNKDTEFHSFGPARYETRYKVGDKVMQTRNDYDKEVFNGNVGTIASFDFDEDSETSTMTVDFDGSQVSYTDAEASDITLAYAATIHKSQGSEYPVVIVVLMNAHGRFLLKRNLVYTGITRGKEHVVIVGESSAYARAVADTSYSERCTLLPHYLDDQLDD